MRTTRWIAGLAVVAAALCIGMLVLRAPASRPNILLITVDTLRADHLGAYGYSRPTSPQIDALARAGVVFDAAFTHAPLSGPSHATMMTGVNTLTHRVINNAVPLPDDQLTLAEVLRAAGYETAMFVSHPLVSSEFDFDQGFDISETYTIHSHEPDHNHRVDVPAEDRGPRDAVFTAAMDWLSQPRERPFFVWLHVQNVHKSYEPPGPFATMFGDAPQASAHELRCRNTLNRHRDGKITLTDEELDYVVALYDGEIAYADTHIGHVLNKLEARGMADETIVMLTADHGELLFDDTDRRISGHGRYFKEHVLRVPLIIRGPFAGDPGNRVSSPVGLIDVAPTLLDLAGISVPSQMSGHSLKPWIMGKQAPTREQHFAATFHSDGVVRLAVRDAPHKLTCNKRERDWACSLFNIETDPNERTDLRPDMAYLETTQRLRNDLETWFREGTNHSRLLELRPPNKKARRLLQRAGYLEDDSDEENGE